MVFRTATRSTAELPRNILKNRWIIPNISGRRKPVRFLRALNAYEYNTLRRIFSSQAASGLFRIRFNFALNRTFFVTRFERMALIV
jgi:hypothetical protein